MKIHRIKKVENQKKLHKMKIKMWAKSFVIYLFDDKKAMSKWSELRGSIDDIFHGEIIWREFRRKAVALLLKSDSAPHNQILLFLILLLPYSRK